MNVLISGSNGFIGSHLKKYYQDQGHNVHELSRDLLLLPRRLEDFIDYCQPRLIIHAAAYGNMSHQTNVDEIFETNIVKTYRLLKAANSVRYSAFILIGSSSEYGSKHFPMKESDLPETETFYGATKVGATYLARSFAKHYNKNIVTVRPFSVYGPGEAQFRLIPKAINSYIHKHYFDFVERPKHDWIYIDDFIRGVATVAEHADELKGQVINIGTGRQVTNKEVLQKLWKTHDLSLVRVQDEYTSLREFDSPNWVADISKIKSLGWRPLVTLEEGLERTFQHYAKLTP